MTPVPLLLLSACDNDTVDLSTLSARLDVQEAEIVSLNATSDALEEQVASLEEENASLQAKLDGCNSHTDALFGPV